MIFRMAGGWPGLLSRSAVTLQRFLLDTLENGIRHVASWVKGVALLYVVGAALMLTGMIAVVNGLAWGVVELGLPPYAAWLILAVATGGVGYLLFRQGSRRGISRDRDERDDDERMGLRFRIVRSSAPVTHRGKRRTKRRGHPRRTAKSGSGHVGVHRADGRIQDN